MPPTNVHIFRSIAEDAYWEMSDDMKKNIRPGLEGNPVVIKTLDSERTSFKQAMISIAFTCIWLEAILHLLIVQEFGIKRFKNVDRCSYKYKLGLLGCQDAELLQNVERLQKARNALIHEKAYLEFEDGDNFTGNLWVAQDEAENAQAVMRSIEEWFGLAD